MAPHHTGRHAQYLLIESDLRGLFSHVYGIVEEGTISFMLLLFDRLVIQLVLDNSNG